MAVLPVDNSPAVDGACAADADRCRVYDEPEYVRMIEQLLWPGRSHWPLQKSWDVDVSRLLFPSVADQQG